MATPAYSILRTCINGSYPEGPTYTTIMELGPQNQNRDGFLVLNPIGNVCGPSGLQNSTSPRNTGLRRGLKLEALGFTFRKKAFRAFLLLAGVDIAVSAL